MTDTGRTWHTPPHLIANIQATLDRWRREHGWERGMVWNPYTATYEWPKETGR